MELIEEMDSYLLTTGITIEEYIKLQNKNLEDIKNNELKELYNALKVKAWEDFKAFLEKANIELAKYKKSLSKEYQLIQSEKDSTKYTLKNILEKRKKVEEAIQQLEEERKRVISELYRKSAIINFDLKKYLINHSKNPDNLTMQEAESCLKRIQLLNQVNELANRKGGKLDSYLKLCRSNMYDIKINELEIIRNAFYIPPKIIDTKNQEEDEKALKY